jgi:FPC/CPF motif-containing protein YcgG
MQNSSAIAPAAQRFRQFIEDATHPCAMAKSVLKNDAIEFGEYGALGSVGSAIATCHGLYDSLRNPHGQGYWSHVALFPNDVVADEQDFEDRLWAHLQRMHDFDASLHGWDRAVSADPADARFSFSIGGRAWYVIGLHPRASRLARRLDTVALVFNPHGQFDDLRTRGKFTTVRDLIRQRDRRLQGSINPTLADHGQSSEARQYSGRAVPAGWKCPFHAAG